MLLFLVGAAATGRLGGLVEAHPDRADVSLPPGRLTPDDANAATFTLAFRGYRMEEVDAAVDRFVGELAERDAELASKEDQISELEADLAAAKQSSFAPSSSPVQEAPAPAPADPTWRPPAPQVGPTTPLPTQE